MSPVKTSTETIEKRQFGRTGHWSTATIFGAAALGRVTQAEADDVLDLLLEYGVNHIDTAASYGDAELRIGPWMRNQRKDFFLATKTEERTYQGALDSVQRSLERLQTDHIDLIQLHALIHPDEWDTAMGPGGALEGVVEARRQGLISYIGVTGHGLPIAALHRRALARFDFDSVLLPYNCQAYRDAVYMRDFEALLQTCAERNVAVQTIKSLLRGPWGATPRTYATWYQPLERQEDIDLAVHWVLGRPGIFLNTVGDIHLLPKVLDAATRYEQRPTDAQMQALFAAEQMTPLFVN
jgi:aryl-alcohol dehydrogenase-like predicted oxidoreductase